MKKSNRLVYLPVPLLKDLNDLGLSDVQRNKAIQLISILKKKSIFRYGGGYIFGEITLSKTYFRDVFNSKYLEFLKPLIESGIIHQNNSYNVKAGISKGYSINNKYEITDWVSPSLCSIYTIISTFHHSNNTCLHLTLCGHIGDKNVLNTHENKGFLECEKTENVSVSYTVKVDDKTSRIDNSFFRKFKNDLKTLTINVDKLTQITVERLTRLSIKDFNVNGEIESPAVKLKFGDRWAYLKTESAINLAKEEGKILVQDKGNYYIEDEVKFITRKVNNIYSSYVEVIRKLDKNYYYASRNFTNNRLDTNITSMCSEFMQVIKEDNDLVELDMANSQFAILSHILPDLGTDDYRLFKELSFSGDLYAHIKDKLGLESIKEAKNITFQVLFGKATQRTTGIKGFTGMFPSVMGWINKYKKDKGYGTFPVMLQKKESNIFIDNLYVEIKKKKLFCLTKHDSLIIRRDDLEEVQEFVDEYFDSICFEGTLRIN